MTLTDHRPLTPLRSVDELLALLRRAQLRDEGGQTADRVGIFEHGLQCAEVLRRWRPDDVELQVAGLVHDLGHVAVPGDPDGHGRHGRALFADLLGDRIAALVELHVPAKRYLVTAEGDYAASLSAGSVRTLAEQGGPMTPEEARAFEREPHRDDAIVLRRADEAAKIPGRVVAPIEDWIPRIDAVAATRRPVGRASRSTAPADS